MRYVSVNTSVTTHVPETKTFAFASTTDLDMTDYANVSIVQEFVQQNVNTNNFDKWALIELVKNDQRHLGDGNLYILSGILLQYFPTIDAGSVLPIIDDITYYIYSVTLQGPGGANQTVKVTSKSVATVS